MTAETPREAGSARYATVAILLHWLIAAAIVLQVVLAGRMEGKTPEAFAVTQLHKSIGITILLLSLARLAWRLTHPPAPLPETMPRWERELARITHVGFYVVMIAMPLTGWLMVSASRIAVPTLLYGAIPWPNIPGVADLAPAAKQVWRGIGQTGHGLIAKLIYVLLALHVAGALKHQLFSKDEPVLARMAPGAKPGRWFEPRLLAIALAAVAVIAFGLLVKPPVPRMGPPPAPVAAPAETLPPETPTPALAADAAAGTPLASAIMPLSRWRVQPGSTLGFVTGWGGQPVQGRFDKWRAGIVFSPDDLAHSSVTVVIDMTSAATGDAQRDEVLPSGDWFDAAAHPEATFRTQTITRTGPDRYVAHGTLDLRGVKKPLDLPFRLKIQGDKAQVTANVALDRTVFGVGQGEFAATDSIPAKVTVRVELQAQRDQRPS